MKKTINSYEFERAFVDMNRSEQFSYAGRNALFEYLEQLEEDTGEEIELDVIALCCEYAEFDSCLACVKEQGYNGIEIEDTLDAEEQEQTALEWLEGQTTVIRFDSGVIIQQF
jgi:hypothetical protein